MQSIQLRIIIIYGAISPHFDTYSQSVFCNPLILFNQYTFPSLHRANRGNSPPSKINFLTEPPFHESLMKFNLLLIFNQLQIFGTDGRQNWGGLDHAVKQLKQPRTPFDHFVLFINKRIVQYIENDQFLINDDFNETNKRRDKEWKVSQLRLKARRT